jgi:TP901-1 family phage major tail protein
MAAQRGKDLLLKVDQTGGGSYLTIGGLRTQTLNFNAAVVDITSVDSTGQWRELLAGAGVRSAKMSGHGIFKDSASDAFVRDTFLSGGVLTWQIVVPGFGTLQGPFQITALDHAAQYNAEITFEMALESAGVIIFTTL